MGTDFHSHTQDRYREARHRIPGGTQLLSKRPEMFAPDCWPAYFKKASGCEIWDLDNRHYYDFSHNGVGSCLLGYAHPVVSRAVQERIVQGSMCTLNPPEEVDLADRLCDIHPWAEQVRFARGGGEACAMAVRIARATTDRSAVAFCGYHGWHDWYLAVNLEEEDGLREHLLPGLEPAGVPKELNHTVFPFRHGVRRDLEAIITEQGERLACIIMEPCRYHDPEPGFLEYVRDQAHRVGALLIFDEITIGWRRCLGGVHRLLGISPDMAVFAKALGNGHPIAAVIGTESAMDGARDSFISSTYWTESVGPCAALATLRVMEETRVWEVVDQAGTSVQQAWRESAERHRLPVEVPAGYGCLAHFHFDHPEGIVLRTLFTQRMLHKGFLAGTAFYPTLAHTASIVEQYVEAVDHVFHELAVLLAKGDSLYDALEGPPAHDGFQRLL